MNCPLPMIPSQRSPTAMALTISATLSGHLKNIRGSPPGNIRGSEFYIQILFSPLFLLKINNKIKQIKLLYTKDFFIIFTYNHTIDKWYACCQKRKQTSGQTEHKGEFLI